MKDLGKTCVFAVIVGLACAVGMTPIHRAVGQGRVVARMPGVKYIAATPEQAELVRQWAEEQRGKIAEDLKIKLTSFETAHCQIITDWDPREHKMLKDNFEAAYTAVTQQFDIPVSENIFLGKLPCFVFSTYESFAKFSQNIRQNVTRELLGYYAPMGGGFGFMVVYKTKGLAVADELGGETRLWNYILTHEMTHAFVARYISDRRVTSWLHEGIAEVIASRRFPNDVREEARQAARKYKNLDKLFADAPGFREPDLYPVMRTLTEELIKKDKMAFRRMFDEIKAGKATDAALKDNFRMTYAQLESIWRQHIQ